jgi:hypothetical protein
MRRSLFRIWLGLTVAYWVVGTAHDANLLLLKLHYRDWTYLLLAAIMAFGVPLAVLGLGRAILWIADSLETTDA